MDNERKETEVTQYQGGAVQTTGRQEIDILAIIEQRNKLIQKVLDAAVSATHAGQWVDQGGKPYPTGAAAEVMARRCGVKITNTHALKEWGQDDKGTYYLYTFTGTASLPNDFDSIEAIGTCSSRDQFFARAGGADRPMSEIDEGNIKKSAYTNMIVNAITRLLGVRNLTWEKLNELGIKRGGTAKVEYKKRASGAAGRVEIPPDDKSAPTNEPDPKKGYGSEAQRRMLWAKFGNAGVVGKDQDKEEQRKATHDFIETVLGKTEIETKDEFDAVLTELTKLEREKA